MSSRIGGAPSRWQTVGPPPRDSTVAPMRRTRAVRSRRATSRRERRRRCRHRSLRPLGRARRAVGRRRCPAANRCAGEPSLRVGDARYASAAAAHWWRYRTTRYDYFRCRFAGPSLLGTGGVRLDGMSERVGHDVIGEIASHTTCRIRVDCRGVGDIHRVHLVNGRHQLGLVVGVDHNGRSQMRRCMWHS